MTGGPFLQLLVVTLSFYHALTADGCGMKHIYSVRCGDECTGAEGYCTCGQYAEKFDYRNDTTWCCNASQCEKKGEKGHENIVCKRGTLLPLTTPCQGECNSGRSYWAARQYWKCDTVDQCIKIQYVHDNVHHCRDRSDERKKEQDVFTPILWDKLKTCYVWALTGDKSKPGVKCSGMGLPNNCLVYDTWCNGRTVMKCSELGGLTSVHTKVCSNNTFWTQRTCRRAYLDERKRGVIEEGKRCTSEYSGQCYYPLSTDLSVNWYLPKTCKDGSHDIIPKNGSCPPTYFSCLVEKKKSCLSPKLHCDIHPQCDDGKDEKNCKHIYKMKRLTKLSGTKTCHHLHYGPNNTIEKPEVEILAHACDGGQPECAGGVDEMCDPLLTRAQLCE